MGKLMYRLLSMLVSLGGGLLATAIFKKVWKLTPGEDEAPKATDASKGWPEVLTAAALQGAIFAVVTASMERLAAAGTRSLTGTWPGEDNGQRAAEDSAGKKEKKA
jgi:uncharacterized protein YidB (DUF937 family)